MSKCARIPWATLLLLVAAAALSSCASSVSSFTHPEVDLGFIQSAAVLPLQNLSDDGFADERIQSLFLMRVLEEEALSLVESGTVREALHRLRIPVGAEPTPEQIVALGRELGVDALFFGVVEEYGAVRTNREQVNHVTATFMLAETQTGVVVWRAQVHRTGRSLWRHLFGGGGRSLHEVSLSVVDAALESLF